MKIAFYKGEQTGLVGAYGKFQKKFDSEEFTHCEIVFSDGMAASSSLRDKGTRFKKIDFHPDRWVFIDVSWASEESARKYFTDRLGTKYDLKGNIFFAFGFVRDDKDKLFCSEACAEALGLKEGWRYSPNGLYQIMKLLEQVHFNKGNNMNTLYITPDDLTPTPDEPVEDTGGDTLPKKPPK